VEELADVVEVVEVVDVWAKLGAAVKAIQAYKMEG